MMRILRVVCFTSRCLSALCAKQFVRSFTPSTCRLDVFIGRRDGGLGEGGSEGRGGNKQGIYIYIYTHLWSAVCR